MIKITIKKFILLILLLLPILINSVYAIGLTDSLIKINNFFENREYEAYTTIIDFMLFFTIVLAAMMIGIKAIFADQMKQGKIIAMIIALITAIALVTGVKLPFVGMVKFSLVELIPYVGFLVFIFLVVIIYFFMLAVGILKEKRVMAFLVAVILAFIIFILLGYIFETDAAALWRDLL